MNTSVREGQIWTMHTHTHVDCYQIQRDYVVFSLDVYSQKVYAIVFCRTPSREQYVYDYSLANVVCHLYNSTVVFRLTCDVQ
jgi:hypothetical protein